MQAKEGILKLIDYLEDKEYSAEDGMSGFSNGTEMIGMKQIEDPTDLPQFGKRSDMEFAKESQQVLKVKIAKRRLNRDNSQSEIIRTDRQNIIEQPYVPVPSKQEETKDKNNIWDGMPVNESCIVIRTL